jgi:hypothetical protein
MANERTYPLLPCADIDQAIKFYEALGFTRTYRQIAPNPSAVVNREDLHIHLFGIPDFDPAQSYGSALVVVPDVDALYHAFAAGLRAVYGKLPTVGFPRITRPRKKFGTVRGFSVVDVGGNWLRISKLGDTEEDKAEKNESGLAKILNVAARLGDAGGYEAKALKTLESGLKKHPDAPVLDHARALLYHAELAVRLGKAALARSSLSTVLALEMADDERAILAPELAQTSELVGDA